MNTEIFGVKSLGSFLSPHASFLLSSGNPPLIVFWSSSVSKYFGNFLHDLILSVSLFVCILSAFSSVSINSFSHANFSFSAWAYARPFFCFYFFDQWIPCFPVYADENASLKSQIATSHASPAFPKLLKLVVMAFFSLPVFVAWLFSQGLSSMIAFLWNGARSRGEKM